VLSDLIPASSGPETIRIGGATGPLRYLDFTVLAVREGEQRALDTRGRETALVTLSGAGMARADGASFPLSRTGVFQEMTSLLYIPPGTGAVLTADGDWRLAIGTAPAVGKYPLRLVTPDEMRVELRGGGAAHRQINHLLAHPLPAERLIVYEAYVPAGAWAGWPPHCHDGSHGSPYLEEVYFVRFDRRYGYGFHRNYTQDGSFDEVFTVHDRDCVVVPRGFHVTTPSPASNMWILNMLAGELIGDDRATPPYFDPAAASITGNWTAGRFTLPVVRPAATAEPAW
jgi:5-deoxy-glucuronate isomerase